MRGRQREIELLRGQDKTRKAATPMVPLHGHKQASLDKPVEGSVGARRWKPAPDKRPVGLHGILRELHIGDGPFVVE